MTQRSSKDEYYMGVADVVSKRSTCVRRNVGCVAVNSAGHIVATGHNGVPRGVVHCIDIPCGGGNHISGHGLDECMAVHAEANALMQCEDVMEIIIIYVTTFPCIQCLKMIMNTGCAELVYRDEYLSPIPINTLPFRVRQYKP